MRLRPLENFAELRPVVHLLVLHLLHRRAGDDETVEAPLLQLRKGIVEFVQMDGGSVRALVRPHAHKGDVKLQRRVREHPQELQLRILLLGHEIQNTDLQRTDVLMGRPLLFHHKQILFLQNLPDRKIVLHFNRHRFILPLRILSKASAYKVIGADRSAP